MNSITKYLQAILCLVFAIPVFWLTKSLDLIKAPDIQYSYRILDATPPEKLFELLGEIPTWLEDQTQQTTSNYPSDPTADIAWSGDTSCINDIQNAFNQARQKENSQLGISLPDMVFPSQAEWDAMTDGEHLLWLVNQERTDRGLVPLHGLEENINSVAQNYADFLMDNNKWGHYEDGKTPWERIDANPTIHACQDSLSISEGLAAYMTTGDAGSIPYSLERSFYIWMYNDGSCCSWGHRHTVLWSSYNNNSGLASTEGFMGVGRAKGGPYQGYNYAEVTVMDVFDPCSTWDYSGSIFSIDGEVNDSNGQALSGVTLHVIDAGGSVVADLETDSTGQYSIDALPGGEYTIVPSLEKFLFLPLSIEVKISDTDVTGVDFEGITKTNFSGSLIFLPEIANSHSDQ